jgi:hypothetical protein
MRLIILYLFFFLSSCKRKEGSEHNNGYNSVNRDKEFYRFEFPDTVYVKKKYDGYLKYRTELDTIVDNFDDFKTPRYAYFLMRKTPNIKYSMDELTKFKLDTLVALYNGEIPLLNIEFHKTGTFYMDGMISDCVLMDEGKKDEKGEELVRMLTYEFRATHKVVVIDSIK